MTSKSSSLGSSVDKQTQIQFYRQMVTIREFEERARELYTQGVIPGILHLSSGQEAVAVGTCSALRPRDFITSTHRGHGHCLAKGAELSRMFAELFGKAEGYCRGKGGSMHLANPAAGHLGANAIVGGSIAIATGAALSARVRKTDQVAVCFFGDGALNQGLLFESMNIAALWRLPVIYVCENNQYGEYTPQRLATAGDNRQRGEVFGIPSTLVDGMDVLAVYEATLQATERARQGHGPSFLVFDTYRYHGHGMSDPDRPYRSREEEREWREKRDPIERLAAALIEAGCVSRAQLESIQAETKRDVEAGVEFAQNAAFPDPDQVTRDVYTD